MLLPTQLPAEAGSESALTVQFCQDLARFARATHAIRSPFHVPFA